MTESCNTVAKSKLTQQAIDWLILLRSDDIEDEELCAFADWLAEDHAHSEAFAEAETLFEQMALAAGSENVAELNLSQVTEKNKPQAIRNSGRVKNRVNFFDWLKPSYVVAASFIIFCIVFLSPQTYLTERLTSDYFTKAGEMREVKLVDGSILLLNTNSAVSIHYDDSIRKVILQHGQVRFTVAKELVRPFVVATDSLNIRALGTVFQVYKTKKSDVKITVQEHAVAINNRTANKSEIVTVNAGQQVQFLENKTFLKAELIDLKQETSWQQQRLIINDRPLAELVEELERYRQKPVYFADEQLKNLRITGVFSLKNPDAILTTVCKVLNLTETRLLGGWSIIHH